MNLKTTILLLLLAAAAGWGGFYWHFQRTPAVSESPTAQFFDKELTADGLTRIEVHHAGHSYVLERANPDAEWALPGQWPARENEVKQIVAVIADLRSRFTPFTYDDKKDVFVKNPLTLTLKLKLGGQDHLLILAEETSEANRFSRPTFVRLDDNSDVLRLAPGLIAALDHDEDYFRMRRVFEKERIAKENSAEKITQVLASAIAIKHTKPPDFFSPFDKFRKTADEKDGPRYRLVKAGDGWEMAEPVRDRVDPEKLKTVLTALAGVWVEKFVDAAGKTPADFGLDNPYLTIAVTRPSGTTLELLLGNVSKLDIRTEIKQEPSPFGGPPKMRPEQIKIEYRYAKLASNNLIFEVKTDTLDEQLPSDARALRDPFLAHFKADDARRLEIRVKDKPPVVLAKTGPKGKEIWKVEAAAGYDAEDSVVSDLLSKLADLQSKKFIDKADPKTYGLDHPLAVVKLTVKEKEKEPEDKDASAPAGKESKASKEAKEITYTYNLGVREKEKEKEKEKDKTKVTEPEKEKDGKLYVQTPGWPRINVLDDALLKLVERPAIAYRTRKLIDVAAADLQSIELRHGSDAFSLEQTANVWRLKTPVRAEVDAGKVGALASALAKLDAVEFVAAEPSKEDLDKVYGLAMPSATAKLHFKDAKVETLAIGKSHGVGEYYARIDQGPIFVVRKDLFDMLMKDELAYRSEKPWDLKAEAISDVSIRKNDQEFTLKKAGDGWKVVTPLYTADAIGFYGEKMVRELSNLKVVKYVPHADKDLAKYGLDKPYLVVKVQSPAGEQTLAIGNAADGGRYARIGKGEVFTLGPAIVAGLDVTAFDLLDRKLVTIEPGRIVKAGVKGPPGFALEQKKESWFVVDSPAAPFAAEDEAAQAYLQAWANLRADKIVAYGPKIDWASYGLDKPGAVCIVVLKAEGKDGKSTEHTLYLGKDVPGGEIGDRYARIDQKPEVIVLSGHLVKNLTKSYLDFVNPLVLKFDRDSVAAIVRQMPGGDVAVEKKGDAWQLVKPDRPADTDTIEKILDDCYRLRGQSVAGYPVKEADLAGFGLDKPAAVVTLKLTDALGKNSEHVIRIGKKKGAGHYALVDKGDTVVVLAPALSHLLLASALNFGDHNLVNVSGVNQVIVQRGPRRVIFLQETGDWFMIDPIRTEAESDELALLVRGLSRLRADEILADKADLKAFGLDRPRIEYKLLAQGKIVVDLAVGFAEAGEGKNPRLTAKLAGKDFVFLLSPTLSAKILDELRGRKPWRPFDVAQVERLSLEGPGRTFTLHKQGPLWTVDDKFDVKVDDKVVIDTLDTLVRLKAQRYVEDTKANLQQYGLAPPALKVEVDSPAGKRVLLIGAEEGTSQRRYASVAGGDSVFVIDAADAAKIMRNLAAYSRK